MQVKKAATSNMIILVKNEYISIFLALFREKQISINNNFKVNKFTNFVIGHVHIYSDKYLFEKQQLIQ